MIKKREIEDIKRLYDLKIPVAQISKTLNRSIPSIYKYIKLFKNEVNESLHEEEKIVPLKIFPFVEDIENKLKSGVFNNSKIFTELESKGFEGSYGLLNNYLQGRRHEKNIEKIKSYEKVETRPGEQAQVDWGQFGKITLDGRLVNLYIFVYVLSYSRAMSSRYPSSRTLDISK